MLYEGRSKKKKRMCSSRFQGVKVRGIMKIIDSKVRPYQLSTTLLVETQLRRHKKGASCDTNALLFLLYSTAYISSLISISVFVRDSNITCCLLFSSRIVMLTSDGSLSSNSYNPYISFSVILFELTWIVMVQFPFCFVVYLFRMSKNKMFHPL